MKKRMLCVLALAMVGLTLDRAEAQGRRGRSRSWSSDSFTSNNGYSAPAGTTAGGETKPSSVFYRIEANGVLVRVPATPTGSAPESEVPLYRLEGNVLVPVTTTQPAGQSNGVEQASGTVQSGSPATYSAPPTYYPTYGRFSSGSCRGGR